MDIYVNIPRIEYKRGRKCRRGHEALVDKFPHTWMQSRETLLQRAEALAE